MCCFLRRKTHHAPDTVHKHMQNDTQDPTTVSRRHFLKQSSLIAASAASVMAFPAVLQAQSKQPLNAVILGVGGRGGGAGNDFLEAAKIVGAEAKVVAVADIFEGQARRGHSAFGIPEERCFSGFDGYQKALEVPGVNYAILAAPPGFRPPHFKACIEAGKHVFMEKPVAVDGPGCRIMFEAGKKAKEKGLHVSAGTQRRHQASYVETVKRIQDGAIGDVVSLRAYWVNGGPIWHRGERGNTDTERQIHNWYHYIWLSGDHIAEQHVHNIDVCNWVMGDKHPVKCWGMGARQMLGDKSGEIWDNFAVEYQYENGVRMHSHCGQIRRQWSSVSEAVHGSRGMANPANSIQPTSGSAWRFRDQSPNPYVQEHVHLMEAIFGGKALNETENVTNSTLTAIMGREAAYSGAEVDWDTALNSKFTYGPDLLYTHATKLQHGKFRTLQPPMPGQHMIFGDPPQFLVTS
jgi:myo-inositol 2-dehydrogenase / D-chiro-inositol 1-dehydrogenase